MSVVQPLLSVCSNPGGCGGGSGDGGSGDGDGVGAIVLAAEGQQVIHRALAPRSGENSENGGKGVTYATDIASSRVRMERRN